MARDWREGEIRDIARQTQDGAMERLQSDLEKLRDGAQASINTAVLLHGDPSLGIKGAIPEIRERLTAVEGKVEIIPLLQADLEQLKAKQNRASRWAKKSYEFLVARDGEGKPTWKRVGALLGAGGGGYGLHWVIAHLWAWRHKWF